MAKKSVGKLKSDKAKGMAKVIIPSKSATTGTYTFEQIFIPTEKVKDFLAQQKNGWTC